MRIDFLQRYAAVQRLLDAKSTPAPTATEGLDGTFLLADQNPQQPGKIENIPSQNIDEAAAERASMRSAPATLRGPVLNPLEGLEIAPTDVKGEAESVKSPTVLEVRRVSAAPEQISKLITEVGMQHGVDPALGLAVAKAESSFNPNAVSSDGHNSKGLFQLLDRTGKHFHNEMQDAEQPSSEISADYDPFNPKQNTEIGLRYLRKLHETFSSETELKGAGKTFPAANSASLEKLAVAAFNAGEGRVASAQARAAQAGLNPTRYESVEQFLPESTRSYVGKVMAFKGRFSATDFDQSDEKV